MRANSFFLKLSKALFEEFMEYSPKIPIKSIPTSDIIAIRASFDLILNEDIYGLLWSMLQTGE
jgi:hypothetical protein